MEVNSVTPQQARLVSEDDYKLLQIIKAASASGRIAIVYPRTAVSG